MFFEPPKQRQTMPPRSFGTAAGFLAALGAVAIVPAPSLAANQITVSACGTALDVNGTTISTSSLTLAELGSLQGVPASTVKLELDEVAPSIPEAAAVDSAVAGLSGGTSLATALERVSTASGGLITRESALRAVVAEDGQPG